MANKTLIIVVAVVLIVVVAGSVVWVCNDPSFNPAPTPTPTTTPAELQEQVREKVISFIIEKHNVTADSAMVNPPLTTDIDWTGGRQETGLVGAETYIYTSDFWTVLIEYPVVPTPIYTVYVDFGRISPQVAWQGTVEDGNVTENNFTYKP